MKKIAAISLLVFLIGYAIYYGIKPNEGKVGLAEGDVAPDFELTTLEGSVIKLSDLRGKKVLVNFWATWCPPCRSEMPDMQKIHNDYGDNVIIAAVNFTSSEKNIDAVQKFVNDLQLTFPVLLDQTGNVNKQYEVLSYPTSYIIDESGVIQTKFVGAMTYEQMKNFLNLD